MAVVVDMYVAKRRTKADSVYGSAGEGFAHSVGEVEVEVSGSVSKDGKAQSSRDGARRLLAAGSR